MASKNLRPKILICDPIAQVGIDMLKDQAQVDIKTGLSPNELLAIIGDYEAVITRSATQITADLIEQAERLQVIGRAGVGLDNIDQAAAKKRGIVVVNSPDASTISVAEHTMALMLGLVRHLPRADSSLKAGQWDKKQFMGASLAGKTLGIIGFGRIGRQVATRAKAFEMKVLVNQRRPTPELNLQMGVKAVALPELLETADFVTLHVPARSDTQNLIGAEQLALMKSTAYLINTARGSVIDEAALLQALEEKQIAGAALDVFSHEPLSNYQLAQHERVIATPHIAASTRDAQEAAAKSIAEQVLDIVSHSKLKPLVPLRVVPMAQVFPHEYTDPRRVKRLAQRLEKDGTLSNPPIVIEMEDRYIVLDGATRTAALRQLNYPDIIVQVISDQEQLKLHTWGHVIRQIEPETLLTQLQNLPEIIITESTLQTVWEDMIGSLCYLHTTSDQVFLIKPASETNHLDALNILVHTYIQAAHVSRTLHRDIANLQREYPDLAALVIFPDYTVDQILNIAQTGRVIPAGITRFIIPGRILHLHADLAYLKSDRSVTEKNEWLNQLLISKLTNRKIRYYEEPVYLLDE